MLFFGWHLWSVVKLQTACLITLQVTICFCVQLGSFLQMLCMVILVLQYFLSCIWPKTTMHRGMQKANVRVLHIQKKPCEVSKTVKIEYFIFAVYAFLPVTFPGVKDTWVY